MNRSLEQFAAKTEKLSKISEGVLASSRVASSAATRKSSSGRIAPPQSATTRQDPRTNLQPFKISALPQDLRQSTSSATLPHAQSAFAGRRKKYNRASDHVSQQPLTKILKDGGKLGRAQSKKK